MFNFCFLGEEILYNINTGALENPVKKLSEEK
jgi:hypothetical protein